jgi:pimeloyl-ACP methyl ester carboxylesterase
MSSRTRPVGPATRFTIAVPDEDLDDLRRRVQSARIARDFANDTWKYGTNGDYMAEVVDYWLNAYDWRRAESEINSFTHWRVDIDDVPIHFVHERGTGPEPVPIVLSHGWPWTFWDFERVIRPLADPGSFGGDPRDAFHVVVPSMPGFGFSSPLEKPGVNVWTTGDLWVRLMREVLGYDTFAAHGGDFGAIVTAYLGHAYFEHLLGIHLSMCTMVAPGFQSSRFDALPEDYTPAEQDYPDTMKARLASAQSHLAVGANDPQTLAYALDDSPVGLFAWLIERRRSWSDCNGDVESVFSRDFLLTTVCLYWFTRTIGTSMRYYAERHPLVARHDHQPPIQAPTAVAVFPGDVVLMPRRFAQRHSNLKRWTVMARGGHFAASERPDDLVADIRAFYRDLR